MYKLVWFMIKTKLLPKYGHYKCIETVNHRKIFFLNITITLYIFQSLPAIF